MEYTRLSLEVRNQNIETISVVLNTLDAISFPSVFEMCKMDIDRFKLINLIQREFGNQLITKEAVYDFFESFEKK